MFESNMMLHIVYVTSYFVQKNTQNIMLRTKYKTVHHKYIILDFVWLKMCTPFEYELASL